MTDDRGEARFDVSPGNIAVGRRVTVILRLPDGERTYETALEALGAPLTAFPPDLPPGK